MLSLRFRLRGKKHQKVYELVVQERRSKLGGRAVAKLGWWEPRLKRGEFKTELIRSYLSHGAQVSDTVWNLLVKRGIVIGKKRPVKIRLKAAEIKASTSASTAVKPETVAEANPSTTTVVQS